MSRRLDVHAKKILIVEDNYLVAESLSEVMASSGFAVVGPAATADLAERLIDRESLDGALLDVRLRKGSAARLAKILRELSIPFVVVTGSSRNMLPPELKKAPYVAKPLDDAVLIEAVRRTFN